YVTDAQNNRVQKFTKEGKFVTVWGETGEQEGQFNNPAGIAVNSKGEVFVVDSNNYRIQKFKK
ncbi:MAG: 6-bladed beta-propeller, partial [Candidatus Goldbacteria bacterium]|nr:6-bladed beta-propeller [Candidatus Goldiibacteriota bacterium]